MGGKCIRLLRFQDRHRLRVSVDAGVSAGGKKVTVDDDEVVRFDGSDVGGNCQEVSMKVVGQ